MKPEQRKQVPCPLRNDRRDRSGSTDGCFGDAALVPERARARAQTSAAAWRRLKGAALAGALAVVAILQGCGSREEVLLGAGLTGAAAGVAGAAGAANNEDDGGAAGVSAKPSVIEFVLVDVGTGLDLRVLNGGERIDVTSEPVTIRAVVDPLPGSVVFKVDGKSVHTDDSPPWTITDSDPVTGALTPWTPDSGKIQIEAEPHIESDGKGNRGTELEQTFVIE